MQGPAVETRGFEPDGREFKSLREVEFVGAAAQMNSRDNSEAAATYPVHAEVSAVECEDLLDAFPLRHVH